MKQLIADLEAAPEGSRELDIKIWVAVNGKGQPMKTVGPPSYNPPRFFCNPSPDIDWIGYDLLIIAPNYTSLDAALTLVPEGCGWHVDDEGVAVVFVRENDLVGHPIIGQCNEASTPPLGICIAALKARQAMAWEA